MQEQKQQREHWGSRIGFILAAAGSAVGLGNIWRFPYMTGENGGAAFVIVYLGCVFFIGLPLLINELALGRASGKNVVGAFRETHHPKTPFVLIGFFCIAACFLVLTYYSVIAGWTIGYAISSLANIQPKFEQFAANPWIVIPLFGLFMLMTIVIVARGIHEGIERWAEILMPLLLIMICVVIVRSLTLEGAFAGVEYYMKPNFSKIHSQVVPKALGQAFFSLSVGWGLMITYGSYMEKNDNIVSDATWVVIADTLVAILGGFMVFPAVFAFGMHPDQGTALTFKTLPAVFAKMPAGWLFGCIFFLLLTIAALTSTISMLEVPVSYLIDEKRTRRKVAAWIVGILAFLFGIPSALSTGAVDAFTRLSLFGHTGVIAVLDYLIGTLLIILIALLCSIYVGWVWGPKNAVKEICSGCPRFTEPLIGPLSLADIWVFMIRFVCPLFIILVLLDAVGIHLF